MYRMETPAGRTDVGTSHRWAWRYRPPNTMYMLKIAAILCLFKSAVTAVPTRIPVSTPQSSEQYPTDITRRNTLPVTLHTSLPMVTTISATAPVIIRSPFNTTVLLGKKALLTCQPEGSPKPVVVWMKDGNPIPLTSSRHIVKTNNNLRIINVSVSDSGTYQCVASNSAGVGYSEYAYLDVQYGVRIQVEPQDINVTYGTMVNLTCRAVGNPKPQIKWLRYKDLVYNNAVYPPEQWNRPYLVRNATQSAEYMCLARNVVKGNHEKITRSRHALVTVENIPKYCATYNGYSCQAHLSDRLVFVDTELYNPIRKQELEAQSLIQDLNAIVVDSYCNNAFRSLLCHSVFPDCAAGKPAKPKPLCREDCLVISEVCYNDWLALNQSKNAAVLRQRLHPVLDLAQCRALPSKERRPDVTCSQATLFEMEENKITTDCIVDDGQFYQGNTNMTVIGLPCQPWTASYPQSRHMFSSVLPELRNGSNYCRNPGGMYTRPGCFPVGARPYWQFCSIPTCNSKTTQRPPPMTTKYPQFTSLSAAMVTSAGSHQNQNPIPMEPSGRREIFIICGVSVAAFCLTCVLVACLMYRRHQFASYSRYKYPGDFDVSKLPENPMYGKDFSRSFNPHLRHLEYPRNDIIYIVDIGEGAFGRVFKAIAPNLIKDEPSSTVAVKMLKADADRDVQEYFNREAEIIARFNHANVIKLLGVCFVGKPLCLLLEYMGRGDLQEYLQCYNPRGKNGTCLDSRTQLNLAYQVACGMVYLTEKRFVHRDIATRNCLVGNNQDVKIADFGLARYLGSGDHYLGNPDEIIPIRWTAPEALWNYKFTTCSDVWSFGVLLWEIFSFARQPYEGLNHEEVFVKTSQGHALECPDSMPRCVYELSRMCCSLDLNARPKFCIVRDTLEAMQDGELLC